MKNFYTLFHKELNDIYEAENQIVKYLPNAIRAASSKELKEALTKELEESKIQVERLENIAQDLDEKLKKGDNAIIKALISELNHVLDAKYDEMAKDAAIILGMQRIKHYEIACYGTLKCFAKHMKLDKAEKLFEISAKEEGTVNKQLTEIAEGTIFHAGINDKACRRCA